LDALVELLVSDKARLSYARAFAKRGLQILDSSGPTLNAGEVHEEGSIAFLRVDPSVKSPAEVLEDDEEMLYSNERRVLLHGIESGRVEEVEKRSVEKEAFEAKKWKS
jgi:hypothetical protein